MTTGSLKQQVFFNACNHDSIYKFHSGISDILLRITIFFKTSDTGFTACIDRISYDDDDTDVAHGMQETVGNQIIVVIDAVIS